MWCFLQLHCDALNEKKDLDSKAEKVSYLEYLNKLLPGNFEINWNKLNIGRTG